MKDSKEAFLKRLGKRVREIRTEKGMTQSELALRCDKDKQSINRLEKGNVNPSIFYLKEIATALEVEINQFIVNE